MKAKFQLLSPFLLGSNEMEHCCTWFFSYKIQCYRLLFYYVFLLSLVSLLQLHTSHVTSVRTSYKKTAALWLPKQAIKSGFVDISMHPLFLRMRVQRRPVETLFHLGEYCKNSHVICPNAFSTWPSPPFSSHRSVILRKLSILKLDKSCEQSHFDNILDQESVIHEMRKDIDSIKSSVPEEFAEIFKEFINSYIREVSTTGKLPPQEVAATVRNFISLVKKNAKFPFAPFHRGIRQPVDYARIGNEFWKPLVDFERSEFPSQKKLLFLLENLKLGKNVLMLSNHQTEPDPQLMRLLFEHAGVPELCDLLIMVAGSRVRTDPLAIPFSMGCNLLSVHSKKHLENPPLLRSKKIRENLLTIRSLQELFREGGKLIWVAPSGGRDRPLNGSDECVVSPFDKKTIELYSRMAEKSSHQTLFVPMALYSYPICPAPRQVNADLGETRTCRRSGVGMAIGEPIYNDSTIRSEFADILTAKAEAKTKEMYAILQKSIKSLS
ncbi:acyltransferase domain-containing protein [Cardiosporidium cionae]|uniref:Acyltransferase domain-containing protein n=1 Tax=Cardiosporidium cionae TaxID=476202 RepID=A0ABQ7JA64_9APIC|nr:acyltransferase domain-containing protein [Cardiosporidium cionae]|eukprot:KAF8820886.1 acyltransferase domain-containing protein [Cardiosporidium cionae]